MARLPRMAAGLLADGLPSRTPPSTVTRCSIAPRRWFASTAIRNSSPRWSIIFMEDSPKLLEQLQTAWPVATERWSSGPGIASKDWRPISAPRGGGGCLRRSRNMDGRGSNRRSRRVRRTSAAIARLQALWSKIEPASKMHPPKAAEPGRAGTPCLPRLSPQATVRDGALGAVGRHGAPALREFGTLRRVGGRLALPQAESGPCRAGPPGGVADFSILRRASSRHISAGMIQMYANGAIAYPLAAQAGVHQPLAQFAVLCLPIPFAHRNRSPAPDRPSSPDALWPFHVARVVVSAFDSAARAARPPASKASATWARRGQRATPDRSPGD